MSSIPRAGDALRSNRDLWDEWSQINHGSALFDVEGFKRGGIRIPPLHVDEVGPVAGKRLLHLQCHIGLNSLSWARLGANVTGVDLSRRAIALAADLAAEIGSSATFVVADVYDLPADFSGAFDIVYVSQGSLNLLPDIGAWAAASAACLCPGGLLYVAEAHPILLGLELEGSGFRRSRPYWSTEAPSAWPVEGSYADPEAETRVEVGYSWNHSVGEIVTAVANTGLRIELLHEWPSINRPLAFLERDEEGSYRLPGSLDGALPLSFSLAARSEVDLTS